MVADLSEVGSPVGLLRLIGDDTGLRALLWPQDDGRVPLPDHAPGTNRVIEATKHQLEEYFSGTRTEFTIPVSLDGTEFQREVWEALLEVAYGETTTYSELASRIGRPTAARAVGAAVGKNPVSIIVPCHRVIGANGDLTGFAGGLETKTDLLTLEGAIAPS